jgi:hypothetical protein
LGLIEVKLKYYEPNRKFLGALLPHAADPRHPLSPFSSRNRHFCGADQELLRGLLKRTATAVPKDLAPYLPGLLWLYQMAIILFWFYDKSNRQQRTRLVAESGNKLIVHLVRLSRLPLARPLRRTLIELIRAILNTVA